MDGAAAGHAPVSRAQAGVRTLAPGYFAVVMATGIVSIGLELVARPVLSEVLLAIAVLRFGPERAGCGPVGRAGRRWAGVAHQEPAGDPVVAQVEPDASRIPMTTADDEEDERSRGARRDRVITQHVEDLQQDQPATHEPPPAASGPTPSQWVAGYEARTSPGGPAARSLSRPAVREGFTPRAFTPSSSRAVDDPAPASLGSWLISRLQGFRGEGDPP